MSNSGATGGTKYRWTPSAGLSNDSIANPIANPAVTTKYIATITTDCAIFKDTVTIKVVQPFSINTSTVSNVSCNGNKNGVANATINNCYGGTYQYSWSNGQGGTFPGKTVTASGLSSATYTITISDGVCSVTSTVSITEPSALTVNSINPVKANCGVNNGSATATATGGTSPFTYLWSNNQTGAAATNLAAGTYTVIIKDVNGCTKSASATVSSIPGINVHFSANPLTGQAPLKVDFSDNTSGSIRWKWNFGDGSITDTSKITKHIYHKEGNYNACLVVQNTGCKDSICETIMVHDSLLVIVPNIFTPNGDGRNDIIIIRTRGVEKLDISIFDRWGLKVAEYNGVKPNEDGAVSTWHGNANSGPSVDGTYYYLLKAYTEEGTTYDHQGYFMLLR